jgi:hypothetical protein
MQGIKKLFKTFSYTTSLVIDYSFFGLKGFLNLLNERKAFTGELSSRGMNFSLLKIHC